MLYLSDHKIEREEHGYICCSTVKYDDEKKHTRLVVYIIRKSVLVDRIRVKASVRSVNRLLALFALYI